MKRIYRKIYGEMLKLTNNATSKVYDFEAGGLYFNILSKDDFTCELTFEEFENNEYISVYSGDVVVPSKVTNNGKEYTVVAIGDTAFNKCTNLTSVVIPETVTKIGWAAFQNCSNLPSITIPESVTEIGVNAFFGCTAMPVENDIRYADTYVIGVTDKTHTSYNIKEGTRFIGSDAFRYCTNLVSIHIPNSVISIDFEAFRNCNALKSIIVPFSVKSIGEFAFEDCKKLESAQWPNAVTWIGQGVFRNCVNLSTIKLGNGINSISNEWFRGCPITEVYVNWTSPAGLNIQRGAFTEVFKITLHVPVGCIENYKTRSPWNDFKEIKEFLPGVSAGGEKCATPTIDLVDGELVFKCETPGAKYYYTIESDNTSALTNSDSGIVKLNMHYKVSAYAYADGFYNSDRVTKLVDVSGKVGSSVTVHDAVEVEKIVKVEVPVEVIKEVEKVVEVQNTVYVYDNSKKEIELESGEVISFSIKDGVIYLENAPIGTSVEVYKDNGKMYMMRTVEEETTELLLPGGQMYTIKVDGGEIKIAL